MKSGGTGLTVLLHGLGGDALAWKWTQSELSKRGVNSLAINLLDDDCTDISLEQIVDKIHHQIRNNNDKQIWLVGHCFGGMIALKYAQKYPEDLQGLVLVSTCTKVLGTRINTVNNLINRLPNWKWDGGGYEKYLGSGDYNLRRIWRDIGSTGLRNYLALLMELFEFDAEKWIREIKIKTRVVCGRNDRVFPSRLSRKIVKMMPNADWQIIDRANHVLVLNNPIELASTISEFENS